MPLKNKNLCEKCIYCRHAAYKGKLDLITYSRLTVKAWSSLVVRDEGSIGAIKKFYCVYVKPIKMMQQMHGIIP